MMEKCILLFLLFQWRDPEKGNVMWLGYLAMLNFGYKKIVRKQMFFFLRSYHFLYNLHFWEPGNSNEMQPTFTFSGLNRSTNRMFERKMFFTLHLVARRC